MGQIKEQYIFIKGKAGLGNRILVLLDSLVYAKLSGRKPIIDWRDGAYAQYGINAFPLLFSEPSVDSFQHLTSIESVAPEVWKGHLQTSVDKLFQEKYPFNDEMDTVRRVARRYTISSKKISYSETVVVRWGWTHELYNLRRFFSGPYKKYFTLTDNEILRSVLKERLRPVDEIQTCVKAFRDRYFGDNTIGLHIRYTDRKNSFDGYYKYVDKFLNEYPFGVVFISTDNIDVETCFKLRYPRVVASEKWYPPSGMPIHRNRHPERDMLQNAREALVELYLLGSCNSLIFNSTSTFGCIASLISDAQNTNLVDLAPLNFKRYIRYLYRMLLNIIPVSYTAFNNFMAK
jgi:hypothetical protein